MKPRQIVAGYFIVQAIGTAAWWALLVFYRPSVKWFQPSDWPTGSLLSFWVADFVLIVAGSAIAATAVWRRSHGSTTVVWTVAVKRCAVAGYDSGYAHESLVRGAVDTRPDRDLLVHLPLDTADGNRRTGAALRPVQFCSRPANPTVDCLIPGGVHSWSLERFDDGEPRQGHTTTHGGSAALGDRRTVSFGAKPNGGCRHHSRHRGQAWRPQHRTCWPRCRDRISRTSCSFSGA
jgi:hypothetical protein